MKKRAIAVVSMSLAVSMLFCLTGCGNQGTPSGTSETPSSSGASDGEKITITVADTYAPTHYFVVSSLYYFIDKVEELDTEDKIEFDVYPSQQLGNTNDMLDVVSQGIADMGHIPMAYFSARMPLLVGAGSLKGSWYGCEETNKAVWDIAMNDPSLTVDFLDNNIRPIIPFTNQSFQLFTTKKQVKTLEDLAGMKIRSSGGVMDDYITALGAIPVQISFNECYEALSRGTVDGIIISAAGAEQADLLETVSYLTTGLDIPGGIYGFAFNEQVWQSYPDDVKEIRLEAGKLANENSGKVLDE